MGFWSDLFNRDPSGISPNPNPPTSVGAPDWNPGDPDGVELVGFDRPVERRSLPIPLPSPWSGWPAEWGVPSWDFGSRFNELVDVAWGCLDLNASVLSSMPVYRTSGGRIVPASTWMTNPDPTIYSSWEEFCKQLFWDFQLGEAFVMPMAYFSDGFPMRFRVMPPWLVHVEMDGSTRRYWLGGRGRLEVTGEILHIRYKSSTDTPRGVGPLEAAGGRMVTAGVLAKYVREIATTGGVPDYTLETDQELSQQDADDLLEQWVRARASSPSTPPLLDNNLQLKPHMAMSPREMAMLEIAQFTESRIAFLLGVPPFLAGLPSTGGGGESMTYSNVSQLFDYHDRASLRPKAAVVMASISGWALPRGQSAELNRDEYSRPSFNDRADAWVKLKTAGLITTEQFQAAERLLATGEDEVEPAAALTGGEE